MKRIWYVALIFGAGVSAGFLAVLFLWGVRSDGPGESAGMAEPVPREQVQTGSGFGLSVSRNGVDFLSRAEPDLSDLVRAADPQNRGDDGLPAIHRTHLSNPAYMWIFADSLVRAQPSPEECFAAMRKILSGGTLAGCYLEVVGDIDWKFGLPVVRNLAPRLSREAVEIYYSKARVGDRAAVEQSLRGLSGGLLGSAVVGYLRSEICDRAETFLTVLQGLSGRERSAFGVVESKRLVEQRYEVLATLDPKELPGNVRYRLIAEAAMRDIAVVKERWSELGVGIRGALVDGLEDGLMETRDFEGLKRLVESPLELTNDARVYTWARVVRRYLELGYESSAISQVDADRLIESVPPGKHREALISGWTRFVNLRELRN